MNKIKDNPRIVIFFVTYKNNFVLEKSLSSINLKQIEKYNPEIYIINNSANFPIIFNKNIAVPYKLLNNNLRVDFSTGHLARNWNQCLIHGFQNLKDPKNDIVLCCQNDVLFKENFLDLLIKNHQKYNFVTYGQGDAAHSYTSEAVRNVGLWDERFCNIGSHEADYWIRNILFNSVNCSINDINNKHASDDVTVSIYDKIKNRIKNENNILNVRNLITGYERHCSHHMESMKYHEITYNLLHEKWQLSNTEKQIMINGKKTILENKNQSFYYTHFHKELPSNYQPSSKQYILYPYFELDIIDRLNKGYAN